MPNGSKRNNPHFKISPTTLWIVLGNNYMIIEFGGNNIWSASFILILFRKIVIA
jgi:hypothetical protein